MKFNIRNIGLFIILLSFFGSCTMNEKTFDEKFRDYQSLRDAGKMDEANKLLDNILKNDTIHAIAWFEKGADEEERNQNSEKAIYYYTKAINLDSNLINAYENRGFSYLFIKDYESALKDFQEAIIRKEKKFIVVDEPTFMEPSIKALLFCRGLAYYNLDSLPQAYKDLSIAIKLDSIPTKSFEHEFTRLGNCYYWRGCILMEWGEIEKGCTDLKKALSLGYTNAQEEVDKYCNCETIKR